METLILNAKPTLSYVVDPETGKLLTAQEWKEKAGKNVKSVELVAIVPGDGSPAFCITKNSLGEKPWKEAMQLAKDYLPAGSLPDGIASAWALPTRKQGIDIRDARSAGLDQLLDLIGGEILPDWYWTREPWIARGTSQEECEKIMSAWSSSRYSANGAWNFSGSVGYANYYVFYYTLQVVASALLNPSEAKG